MYISKIVDYYHENKDHVLKLTLFVIHLVVFFIPFFRVFNSSMYNSNIYINILEMFSNDAGSISFPITLLLVSFASVLFYYYSIKRKTEFSRMNYIYALTNNVLIIFYMYFLQFENKLYPSIYVFYIILIVISFLVSIYLFKFADTTIEEDFTLRYRKTVITVFHIGYGLMLWNFIMFIIIDENGFPSTYGFEDYLRIVSVFIYVFSIFFIKREFYLSRLYSNLYAGFAFVWMTLVFIREEAFEGEIMLFVIMLSLLMPLILLNYDLVFKREIESEDWF